MPTNRDWQNGVIELPSGGTALRGRVHGNASFTWNVDAAGAATFTTIAVANGAAATTLGTVTGKVELFDSAGASLGFLPLYGGIA